jgi:quercetin dioxygenase-like cupin family protein
MPFFKWDDMLKEKITPSYSPAEGPTIKGEKIEVGLFFYPAGGEGKPHSHPNEQVQVILRGRSLVHIGDEERMVGPGDAFLIPANTVHWGKTLEDTEVINCKDVVAGWSIKNAKWEK